MCIRDRVWQEAAYLVDLGFSASNKASIESELNQMLQADPNEFTGQYSLRLQSLPKSSQLGFEHALKLVLSCWVELSHSGDSPGRAQDAMARVTQVITQELCRVGVCYSAPEGAVCVGPREGVMMTVVRP
eukprot:TRINITY_DN12089_c0_g2_i1.p2 TRINITY_DN12089_c0_g2~~TRINITY_DN12089_c0_g2_i1.p2  ORF type:complete len:130 (-),score=42.61 TRINITY_DN12089_c0_g2_i1:150-539(-)